MKTIYSIAFALVALRPAQAQLVLTEVMFDPAGPEASAEFIEIFNRGSVTVDLAGYRVGDQDQLDALDFPGKVHLLPPNRFAVIFDADYFDQEAYYDPPDDSVSLVLSIDDATFGSGGLANSRSETIRLVDPAGREVDRYAYSVGNESGHSDERVRIPIDSAAENWRDSRDRDGTPGRRNSVSPRDFDLALSAAVEAPASVLRQGGSAALVFTVRNAGELPHPGGVLRVFGPEAQPIGREDYGALASGDSLSKTIRWIVSQAGSLQVTAHLHSATDEDSTNDRATVRLVAGWPRRACIISEVMFQPAGFEPEWVELYNTLAHPITLNGWRLRDRSGKTGLVFLPKQAQIGPHGYAILSADTIVSQLYPVPEQAVVVLVRGFPALNDDADALQLLDFLDLTVDTMSYAFSGSAGISIELTESGTGDPGRGQWLSSRAATGATPGRRNSVSPVETDAALDSLHVVSPRLRLVRGDTVFIRGLVRNAGTGALAAASLQLDIRGTQVQCIGDSVFAELTVPALDLPQERWMFVLDWQPLRSGRQNLRANIAVAGDQQRWNNAAAVDVYVGARSADLVINEVQYQPSTGDAEWVELINPGPVPVELYGWRLGDAHATSRAIAEAVCVPPGGFVVLSSRAVPMVGAGAAVVLESWPGFSNTGDAVVLYDLTAARIDSVSYEAGASPASGVSLERINPRLPAVDRQNWQASAAPRGATPGEENSLFAALPVERGSLTISPNPFSPDADGHEDTAFISYRVPFQRCRVTLTIYDLRGRAVHRLLNNAVSGPSRQVVWQGRSLSGMPLPWGLYIVLLEALDDQQGRLERVKATLVLAGNR